MFLQEGMPNALNKELASSLMRNSGQSQPTALYVPSSFFTATMQSWLDAEGRSQHKEPHLLMSLDVSVYIPVIQSSVYSARLVLSPNFWYFAPTTFFGCFLHTDN